MQRSSVATPGGFRANRTEKKGLVRSRLGIRVGASRSAPAKESLRTAPKTAGASRSSATRPSSLLSRSLPRSGDTATKKDVTPATKMDVIHSGITSATLSSDKGRRRKGPRQKLSRKGVQSAPVNCTFFRVPSTSFVRLKEVPTSKQDNDMSQPRSAMWGSGDNSTTLGQYGRGQPEISEYHGNRNLTSALSGEEWKPSSKKDALMAQSGETFQTSLLSDLLWNRTFVSLSEIEKQKQEWYKYKLAEWTKRKNEEERRKRSLEKKEMQKKDNAREQQAKKEMEERIFKEWIQKKDKELKERRAEESKKLALRKKQEREKKERQKLNFNDWVKKKDEECRAKRKIESHWWDKDENAVLEEIKKHVMSNDFTEKLIEKRNREIIAELKARELRRQEMERLRQEAAERRRRFVERPWAVWNITPRVATRSTCYGTTVSTNPTGSPSSRSHTYTPTAASTASCLPWGDFGKATPINTNYRVSEGCRKTLLPVKLDHK